MDASRTQKKGFSLIEVIVSVALFSIILTVALGALLMVIDANKQAKAIKIVVNNLNLALEGMSRELRVGSKICQNISQTSCNTASLGSDAIYFSTDRGDDDSTFFYTSNAIWRRVGPDGPSNPALKLTGADVTIESLKFYIRGIGFEGAGSERQPSVVIALNGYTRRAEEVVEFDVQTTVSQRKLDL